MDVLLFIGQSPPMHAAQLGWQHAALTHLRLEAIAAQCERQFRVGVSHFDARLMDAPFPVMHLFAWKQTNTAFSTELLNISPVNHARLISPLVPNILAMSRFVRGFFAAAAKIRRHSVQQ